MWADALRPPVTRSRLLVGVASVLAGTTALLFVFGLVYNPIILVAAVPFGAATFFIWSHATGRLDERMRERARARPTDAGSAFGRDGRGPREAAGPGATTGPRGGPRETFAGGRTAEPRDGRRGHSRSAVDAARVLGVDPEADDASIRRAYREKAKALHPDAPDGDEAAFRRVRDAYERLQADR